MGEKKGEQPSPAHEIQSVQRAGYCSKEKSIPTLPDMKRGKKQNRKAENKPAGPPGTFHSVYQPGAKEQLFAEGGNQGENTNQQYTFYAMYADAVRTIGSWKDETQYGCERKKQDNKRDIYCSRAFPPPMFPVLSCAMQRNEQ